MFPGGVISGSTGPTGSFEPSFIYAWASDEQSLPPAPTAGGQGPAVEFTDFVASGAVPPLLSASEIIILESGYYNISWQVYKTGYDSAFALFLDDVMIPGSNYGALAHDEAYRGQTIAALGAGGLLTLNRIDDLYTQAILNQIGGGTPVTGASIVIMKIG